MQILKQAHQNEVRKEGGSEFVASAHWRKTAVLITGYVHNELTVPITATSYLVPPNLFDIDGSSICKLSLVDAFFLQVITCQFSSIKNGFPVICILHQIQGIRLEFSGGNMCNKNVAGIQLESRGV